MSLEHAPSSTVLRAPWVHLARLGWILLSACVLLVFVTGTLAMWRTPLPSCATPNAACTPYTQITREDAETAEAMGLPLPLLPVMLFFSLAARLSLAAVGILIFLKRSDDWVAFIISTALMSVLLEGVQNAAPTLVILQQIASGVGTVFFIPIPFIFPNGRITPAWLKWPIVGLTLIFTVTVVLSVELYVLLTPVLTFIWIALSIYSIWYRFTRASTPVERQQSKWVVAGLIATFLTSSYYVTAISLFPVGEPTESRIWAMLVNGPVYALGYGFFAFSMLFAMLRHRLWDVDVLIRRTLQYGLLTGLLALVYFGGIVVLQGILGPMTGRVDTPLVTVLTTLGIAALFNPLRRRVQDFIDRRFYRRKFNAEKAVERFASAARDEVDVDRLGRTLLEVVGESMQPERASLWVKAPARDRFPG